RECPEQLETRPLACTRETMGAVATEFSNAVRETCPEPATGDLWSTYVAIVEDRLGIFHPEVDYIIHALGKDRHAYALRFAEVRPRFVQTMRRDWVPFQYEEWLQTTSWDFYERLLLNYEIIKLSDWSLLWRRTDRPWRAPQDDPGNWHDLPEPGESQE